jgi:signal-transduction protein with cAMP-binding, CBS, and nucleotidyltransferase domain
MIQGKEPGMRVREIMTTKIWSCSANATVASAAETMLDRSCGFVPVVGSHGEVLGVVTDRDLCMALVKRDRRASEVPIAEVCSGRIVTCAPDDEVHDILQMMENAKIRRLPVVEDGKLRGIISMTDVLRHAQPAKSETDCLTCAEAVGTLKMINSLHRPRKPWVAAAE